MSKKEIPYYKLITNEDHPDIYKYMHKRLKPYAGNNYFSKVDLGKLKKRFSLIRYIVKSAEWEFLCCLENDDMSFYYDSDVSEIGYFKHEYKDIKYYYRFEFDTSDRSFDLTLTMYYK